MNLEISRDSLNIPKKSGSSSNQLFYRFIENFQSETTKKAYINDLKSFFKYQKSYHNVKGINEISLEHGISYRNHLENIKKLKETTVNGKLISLSSFFEYLW